MQVTLVQIIGNNSEIPDQSTNNKHASETNKHTA